METGLKEKVIMHALWPERRHQYNSTPLKHLLFYASVFDLIEKGIVNVENKRIKCRDAETGDPVLDDVVSLLLPYTGKKLSRIAYQLVPKKASGVYRKQKELMAAHNLLEKEDISILMWKVGNNYRVRNYDILKPGIKKLERVLVYGRKPDRQTMLLAVLAREGKLFKNIFRNYEFRKNAEKNYKMLLNSELIAGDHAITALRKSYKQSLNVQYASGTVTTP